MHTTFHLHTNTFYLPLQLHYWHAYALPQKQQSLIIVTEGVGKYRTQDGMFSICRGSVISVTKESQYDIMGAVEGIQIIYEAHGQAPNMLATLSPLRGDSYIVRMAQEMKQLTEQAHPSTVTWHKLFLMMIEALEQHQMNLIHPTETWFAQTLNYIHQHFTAPLTREEMAYQMGVTPAHFSRTFHKQIGMPFNQYVALLRIRKAQQRLLIELPSLEQLGQSVGYMDRTYFSRKFKQVTSMSPTLYYEKLKRVAALNSNHTGCLLALGIIPVYGICPYWLTIQYQHHTQLMHEENVELNREILQRCKPDVVIHYNRDDQETILPIAPLVDLPCLTMTWREQFMSIARIVQHEQKAKSLLQHYDNKIQHTNYILDTLGVERGVVIVWEICEHFAYSINSKFGRSCHILYEDLQFEKPEFLKQNTIGYVKVPIEEIVNYDAAYIFITALPKEPYALQQIERIFESDKWQSLQAVRNNQYFIINDANTFYGYAPLSTNIQLDRLMTLFTS